MATASCDNTNVVFIDTNLDTHLALIVSDLDTVSDLKKRIVSEHPSCFPKIGQIQIHGIKVKRRGYFYHLSDSMFVRSAFDGVNKSWFLSVDASALGDCGQNEQLFSHDASPPNQVALDLVGPGDNAVSFPSRRVSGGIGSLELQQLENKRDESEDIPVVSPCVLEHTGKEAVENLEDVVKACGNGDMGIPLPGSISIPETEDHCHVNHEVPSLHIECEVDGSGKGVKDDGNVCEEDPPISVPSAKRKRKSKRKKEDTVRGDDAKDNNIASVDNPLSCPSERASSFDNFQVPQSENKQDEEEEVPSAVTCVSEHTEKAVENLEMDMKSSGDNDHAIPFPSSIPETRDNCCVNHELPNSHIESEVDGSNKGNKDDGIVCEEGTSKRKRHKSKRKKEHTVQDITSKENDASVVAPADCTVQQDTVDLANSSENADKEVIKGTEVSKEHRQTEGDNNNAKNDIDAVSRKEAPVTISTAKKKHGKRERSLTHDSKEMLKVETSSHKDGAQMSDEAHEERKESKDQLELNNDKSRDDVEYMHNKVTEDILDTRTPAKKRQKGKEKNGEKSLAKKKLINDFNVDNASQKDLHETPVVTSSREDEEPNHSSIQREGVQMETSEDCLLSKDIIASKTIPDKMEIRTDACEESIQSTVERTGNYKNHCDIEIKIQPSDVNEPKDLTEDNENVVLRHCHESEAGQTEGAEKGREVSPQNDPKLMLLERCTPSNQDNTNANVRESNVTSNVVDVNAMNEPVKSGKKKRVTKKSKNSGGELALRDGIGLVDASESETVIVKSLEVTICDPMSGNTETEENPLNQTEGEKIRQEEMQETVRSVNEKEDDFSADNGGSLEQIKTKSNAENVDDHVDKRQRKKSNKKQTSTSKIVSDILTKDQVFDSKRERDIHRIHPDKKVPNAHKTGQDAKLSSRSDSAMSSIGENRKPRNKASGKSMDLEKQREHIPISKSKLERPNKMVQNKVGKASRNNIGGVVSNKQQKKSLLEGEIFKDDSSSSSKDEDGVGNSDASTRTPSDNSLLSDFSDGDSGLDSQQNGSYGGKRLENGERSSLKASLSGTKGMSIDHVLRSSRRYKKAKITASQLDETESQPEFVPDSLADM